MFSSELIITDENQLYHLHLSPGDLAKTIITVGDPKRVKQVSDKFDSIELRREHREFVTHTGMYRGKRLSVISTGIGTDNIDIVLNEIDALFNVDFKTRRPKSEHTELTFLRVGTSGAMQPDIPVDTHLCSASAIGLDGLMHFYPQYAGHIFSHELFPVSVYKSFANEDFIRQVKKLLPELYWGCTLTTAGFYGPQGRAIRIKSNLDLDKIAQTTFFGQQVTNIEMETAGIYALSHLLGHRALSFNAILANRAHRVVSEDFEKPIDSLIEMVLNLTLNV